MYSQEYIYSSDFAAFMKLRRRECANIFNVFFQDTEVITEQCIQEDLAFLSDLFGLSRPDISFGGDAPLQVELSSSQSGSIARIKCNTHKLQECGFNNKDAVIASLCHELSHIYSSGQSYGYCENEYWEAELYADFMASAIMTVLNVAGGKYRYIIGNGKATKTHPLGKIRLRFAMAGREYALSLPEGATINLADIEGEYLLLLLMNTRFINTYLTTHKAEISQALDPDESVEIDYMKYQDTNLLKQYILKQDKENDK